MPVRRAFSTLRWLCAVACVHSKRGVDRQGVVQLGAHPAHLRSWSSHKKTLQESEPCPAFNRNASSCAIRTVRPRRDCAGHDDDASLCPKRMFQGRPCVYDESNGKCRRAGYPVNVPANARQHPPNVKPKKSALLQAATTQAVANADRSVQNGVRPRRDCSMLDHNASLCMKRHFRGHRCVYNESNGRCRVDLVSYAARFPPASSKNATLKRTNPPNVKPKKIALLQAATTQAVANADRSAQNGVRPRRDCSMLDHNASLCMKRHFRGHRCVYNESNGRCRVDLVSYAARFPPASSKNATLKITKPRATVMPLHKQVAMLKRELAVSGTFIEVVHRSARHLGIKQEGVPLRQLAARCIEMLGF